MAESDKTEDKSAIDPELVNLPRSAGIRPILGFSLLGLAIFLAVHLRADFVYGLADETPVELAPSAQDVPDNQFVTVTGPLDYAAAGRLRGRQSMGSRLTPILGSDGRGWVHEPAEALATEPREAARVVGRVRRLDRMGFADELAAFRAQQQPIPRVVFPEAIKGALPTQDALGTSLVTTPDTAVVAVERVSGVALVTVIQTQQVYDDDVAQRALVAAGVLPAPRPPISADDASWTYEVPAPEGAAKVVEKLRAGKIFGASATDRVVRHETTVAKLTLAGDALVFDGKRVAISSLDRLIYYVRLPDRPTHDSWVILAGDSPGAYWYMKLVYGGLALLVLFVGMSLIRWFRGVIMPTAARKR